MAGAAKATGEYGAAITPLKKEPRDTLTAAAVRGVDEMECQKVEPDIAKQVNPEVPGVSVFRHQDASQVINLFSPVEMLHALPEAPGPEFIEVEFTLDTGATVHAADRVDFPKHKVFESEGSRAGQRFQGASGKFINNGSEINVTMLAPRV